MRMSELTQAQKDHTAQSMAYTLIHHITPRPNSEILYMFRDEPTIFAGLQRELRKSNCGFWYKKRNFDTGGYRTLPSWCDVWRECTTCFNRRKTEQLEKYQTAIDRHGIDSIAPLLLTSREWASLRRKVKVPGKDWYKRYPTLDGTSVTLVNAALIGVDLSKYTHIDHSDLDWDNIVNTPQGQRYSGNLGNPIDDKEPESDEPTLVIEHAAMFFDFTGASEPQVLLEHCAEQFALEYAAQHPRASFDKKQIELGLAMCNSLYIDYLIKHGCRLTSRHTIKERMTYSQYKICMIDRLIDTLRVVIETTVPTKLGQACLFAAHGITQPQPVVQV